ncbi:YybH family protein [Bernardetia sp. OM2101]|uniref:YybH family protein n=1 Tax=Bernardetia sp. OM2101 TaxID=3344876 RepID=UPI0035CF344C
MKKSILLFAVFMLPFVMYAKTTTFSYFSTQNPINKMTTQTVTDTEKEQIKKLLFSYRDALNESNVEKSVSLYTENGVFMPSNAPTSTGKEQVKAAYQFVFSNIKLSIEFFIDEIEIVGQYAFVRSTSKGSTLIHATGDTIPEENRELFVLKKENGNWKIDRYMFNKMK